MVVIFDVNAPVIDPNNVADAAAARAAAAAADRCSGCWRGRKDGEPALPTAEAGYGNEEGTGVEMHGCCSDRRFPLAEGVLSCRHRWTADAASIVTAGRARGREGARSLLLREGEGSSRGFSCESVVCMRGVPQPCLNFPRSSRSRSVRYCSTRTADGGEYRPLRFACSFCVSVDWMER